MAESFADWCKESTTTTGTGTITLAGATAASFTEFADVLADGAIVPYCIIEGNDREEGLGTFTLSGTTLARTTVQATWVAGVYDDTTPTAITLAGAAEVYIAMSSFQAMSKTDTKFTNMLYKDTATLNGTATDNHVNLGDGVSVTGTAAQAYDFCTIGGGEGNTSTQVYTTVGGGLSNDATAAQATISGGKNSTASGTSSTIGGGQSNNASNTISTIAGGASNNAISYGCAVIGGGSNQCRGTLSTIGGGENNACPTAGSYNSILGGASNTITGTTVRCFLGGGSSNTISSDYATLGGGLDNEVTGNYGAIIGGRGNKVSHTHATAMNGGSDTRANFDVVIGATDTATAGVGNNTIRLQGTGGNILADGSLSTPEADYAEMFEWFDQNPDEEDRVGYFVSLHQGKIVRGAGREDKSGISNYLASVFTSPNGATSVPMLGVISGTPSVLGDAAPNHWIGRHLKDKFNRNRMNSYIVHRWTITTPVTAAVIDEEDGTIPTYEKTQTVYVDTTTGIVYDEHPQYTHKGLVSSKTIPELTDQTLIEFPKVKESYDNSVPYTARRDRNEWDAVGMLGKLVVHSAEPITSDWVKPTGDGRAMNAANGVGYQVLEIIDNYTVRILFK